MMSRSTPGVCRPIIIHHAVKSRDDTSRCANVIVYYITIEFTGMCHAKNWMSVLIDPKKLLCKRFSAKIF